MIVYADTNFFTHSLLDLPFSPQADALLESLRASQAAPLPVTWLHGFRTYDLFHVASALVLGCDTFWSFDAKAKKLAQLEGLTTN